MKDTEFAYAVARVRSNEARLLSSSAIESLISSKDYDDALRLLGDMGFESLAEKDEETVLSQVLRQAFELIYTSAPDKKCLDFLIVRNDFHNIKAILKCMISGQEADKLLLYPSVVEPSVIKSALDSKDYSLVPQLFSVALEKAYELITTTNDGQRLEIFLDKKCLEASVSLAEQSKDEFSISLANLMCALYDIRIALRCLRTKRTADFVAEALAACALVDTKQLCLAVTEGEEELRAYVEKIGLSQIADSIKNGYAAFEKACDDMLMERVKGAKYQCLGIAPLVAYYFAVDAQVKTVRIILSCKKNGIDNQIIRERVRVLYV